MFVAFLVFIIEIMGIVWEFLECRNICRFITQVLQGIYSFIEKEYKEKRLVKGLGWKCC